MPYSFNWRKADRSNAQDGQFDPTMSGQPSQRRHYLMAPREMVKPENRTRVILGAIVPACLFLTLIWLIMVEIGNVADEDALRDIWFLKLDVSALYPSAENLGIGDIFGENVGQDIDETLGMYDYYTVGLWNYCGGMHGKGVVACAPTHSLYWFDPIEVFAGQLASTVIEFALPPVITSSLHEIRLASHIMFGFFMTGACLTFVLIPITFLGNMYTGVKKSWVNIGLTAITWINGMLIMSATVIATVLYVILRNEFKDYESTVDTKSELGSTMFAMMWLATVFVIASFFAQVYNSFFSYYRREPQLTQKEIELEQNY